jgi:transcriptional regulator with XRE-family HTH domain
LDDVPKQSPRDEIAASVIAALRTHRLDQGVSMNALAERSGLSLTMISFVERGIRKPTLDTLLRISEALGVSLGKLIHQAEISARRR